MSRLVITGATGTGTFSPTPQGSPKHTTDTELVFYSRIRRVSRCPGGPVRLLHYASPST